MFGFILGTVCLLCLAITLKRGRHHQHGRHEGFGQHAQGGRGGRMMRYAFAELGTSVAQEKVLREAFEKVRETTRGRREIMQSARVKMAQLLRAPSLDQAALDEVKGQLSGAGDAISESLKSAFASVHETLTVEQRNRLADRIERGPFGFGESRGFGHHHGHGRCHSSRAC